MTRELYPGANTLPFERDAIARRLVLDGPLTTDSIAVILGLTRMEVRRIEEEAMRKVAPRMREFAPKLGIEQEPYFLNKRVHAARYAEKLRKERLESGQCTACGGAPKPGRKQCAACNEEGRRKRLRHREKHAKAA